MIIVADIIKTAPDGIGKAMEWASKAFDYLKKAGLVPGRCTLMRPHTGDRNERLTFASRYASLSEYDEYMNKCLADSGYTRLIEELRKQDWFCGSEKRISDVIKVSD
jgi:hypothetical protein